MKENTEEKEITAEAVVEKALEVQKTGKEIVPIKTELRSALEAFFNYEAAQPYFQAVAAEQGYTGSDPVEIYNRLVVANEDGEISFCNKDLPILFERFQMLMMGREKLMSVMEPAGLSLVKTPAEDALIIDLMVKMKNGTEITEEEMVETITKIGALYSEEEQAAVLKIAQTCHEVNKTYCESHDDMSQLSWEDAPEWQKESAVKGVYYVIENPDGKPSDTHVSWMKEKVEAGWVYGEVKDAVAKTHPCIVPYEDLDLVQKTKDKLFLSVVRSLAN